MENEFSQESTPQTTTMPEFTYEVSDFMSGKVDQNKFLEDIYGKEQPETQGNDPQQPEVQNTKEPTQPATQGNDDLDMFMNEGKLDFNKLSTFINAGQTPVQADLKPAPIEQQIQQPVQVQQQQQPVQPEISEIEKAKNSLNQVFDLALQYQQRFNIPIEQAKEMALDRITESLNEHSKYQSIEERFNELNKKFEDLQKRPDSGMMIQRYNDNLASLSKEHGFNSPRNLEQNIINHSAPDLCALFDMVHPDKAGLNGQEYNKEVYKFMQQELTRPQMNSLVKIAKANMITKSWSRIQEQLQKQQQQQSTNNQQSSSIANQNSQTMQKGYSQGGIDFNEPEFAGMKRLFPEAFK